MYKLSRWWSKQINRVLTRLHTPCHSYCCTSFSACYTLVFQFFFNVFQFSIMFLVKFLKRSFLDIPITTNMFSVLEFCWTPCSYTQIINATLEFIKSMPPWLSPNSNYAEIEPLITFFLNVLSSNTENIHTPV